MGRKSYNTGFCVFKYGLMTCLDIGSAVMIFNLFKHTPLGMPVLPEVYMITATLSRSVSVQMRVSGSVVSLAPRLNKSEHVYTSADSFLASSRDDWEMLSENMMCFIGFWSPKMPKSLIIVFTCLSIPSTKITEHFTFLIMNSKASTPKLS